MAAAAWRSNVDIVELLAVLHSFGFCILHYSENPTAFQENNLLGWGSSWESFFFLLHGFKLNYAWTPNEKDRQHPVAFALQKLFKVYPFFVVSIGIKVVLQLHFKGLNYQKCLLAFLRSVTLWKTPLNAPAWLLRPLTLQWLLWGFIDKRMRSMKSKPCWCGLCCCLVLLVLRMVLWRSHWKQLSEVQSLMTLPLFLGGTFLGRLADLRHGKPVLPLALPGGRLVGLGGFAAAGFQLMILHILPSTMGERIYFKLGLLAPFQAFLLVSLSSDADLLSQLLQSSRLLTAASRWRYAAAMLMDSTVFLYVSVLGAKTARFPMTLTISLLLPASLLHRCCGSWCAGKLPLPFPTSQSRRADLMPLDALPAMELLAILHVLGFHLIFYSKFHFFFEQNFLGWGGTWDPFFFVASGFKTVCVQLAKADPSKIEPSRSFMYRRIKRLYPMYLFTLLLKGIQNLLYDNAHPSQLPHYRFLVDWKWLPLNLIMWQTRWNGPAWFARNIIVHSFVLNKIMRWLVFMPVKCCWLGVIFCCLFTYLRIYIWKAGKTINADLHLTQNSLMNLHMTLCGAFLARISRASGFRGALPVQLRGCRMLLGGPVTLGLLATFAVLSPSASDRVPVKVGLLLPLQALLVHSLAAEGDAFGRFCRYPPLRRLGLCAYALSMLQDPFITVLHRHWLVYWQHFDFEAFLIVIMPMYISLGVGCAEYVEPAVASFLEGRCRKLVKKRLSFLMKRTRLISAIVAETVFSGHRHEKGENRSASTLECSGRRKSHCS